MVVVPTTCELLAVLLMQASCKVPEATQPWLFTKPIHYAKFSVVQPDSRTRTAVSSARADQGVLIGRNTEGIEDGVSVSAKYT